MRFFPLSPFILFVFQHVYNFSGIIITECFCDDRLAQYLQSLNCGKHVYKEKDGTHTHTQKIYQASFVPRKHRSRAGYGSYPASYVSGWRRSGHHLSIGMKGSSSVLTSLRRGAALMEPCTGGRPQGCVSTDWHDILLQPKLFCDSMIQAQRYVRSRS